MSRGFPTALAALALQGPGRRIRVARPTGRTTGLIAVVVISAFAVVALGGSWLLAHPGRGVFGRNPSNDFQLMAWSLRFWPWVLGHGGSPWHTPLLWAPSGFSTLWLTTIPGPALLALPLTLTAGPIAAYNVLLVAAVCAASAAAYLLCWELTAHTWASIAGGLAFGLSPYVLGHAMSEHLNLLMVFPLPFLVLLAVRYGRGKLSRRRFIVLSAVLLLFLATSSLELFVDATLVLSVVTLLALTSRAGRDLTARLAVPVGAAYACCLPVLLPIALLGLSSSHAPVSAAPAGFSTDVLNLVVPTATAATGTFDWAERITSRFVGNIGERDGYLGLPLLVMCVAVLRARWRRYWPLGLLLAVAVVLSLGPILTVGGKPVASLPDRLDALPVLGDVLPARFAVFAFLAAAPLAALWLATPRRTAFSLLGAAALVASLAPNVLPAHTLRGAWPVSDELSWSTHPLPAGFVADGRWRRLVPSGANVLVLPTADWTAAQWWQAESNMGFRLAVTGTPFVPPQLAADPTVARIVDDVLPQLDGVAIGSARLRAFLHARRIGAVVVTPRARAKWLPIVRRATGRRPARLHGDLVFTVPPQQRPLEGMRTIDVAGQGIAHQPRVHVWLTFAGSGGRVWARIGHGHASLLSSDDAQSATAASTRRGTVVAMLDATTQDEVVRVARMTRTGWRIATLARTRSPIWSLHPTITAAGTALAGWIAESGRTRRLLLASAKPDERWGPPVQLDAGSGLGSFAFARGRGDRVSVFWRDAVANEWRLIAARYHAGSWSRASVLETALGTPPEWGDRVDG